MGRVIDASPRWWLLVAAFALLTGCGDSAPGGEYVWLQVFNAYPGSQAASVYGPSGTITSNLAFGERTSSFIRVNRNLGGELQIVLQGAPRTFTGNASLFNMYPQESGTLIITRRSNTGQVETELVRHVDSALAESSGLRNAYQDGTCRTVFANRLSVDNSGLAQWNYIPRMQIEAACTGYARFVSTAGGTYDECSTAIGRPALMRALYGPDACTGNGSINYSEASRWFIPVESTGGSQEREVLASVSQCPVVSGTGQTPEPFDSLVGRGTDEITFIYAGPEKVENQQDLALMQYAADVDVVEGQIVGAHPANDYMECLGYDREASLSENEMDIEPNQVARCRAGTTFNPVTAEVGGEITESTYIATPPGIGVGRGPDQCGYPLQIETDFNNVFQDPEDGEVSLVDSEDQPVSYPPGQHYYWYLYGRPVNPRIESWSVEADGDTPGGTIDPGEYPDGDR